MQAAVILHDYAPACGQQIQLEEAGWSGPAKSAWIARMTEAMIPDARSPDPGGPPQARLSLSCRAARSRLRSYLVSDTIYL